MTHVHRRQRLVLLGVGLIGLVLYNWWIFAAFDPHALRTTNQLFSDLEATGEPHARLLSNLDLAAGVLIALALLLQRRNRAVRLPGDLLIVFGLAAAVGGLFPYSCAEGVSRACRDAEWSMALPWQQYVHIGSGIVEFAGATLAILALRAHTGTVHARAARLLTQILVIAYPLLAVAYIGDRLGAFIEPIFFVSFSIAVVLALTDEGRHPLEVERDAEGGYDRSFT
jgi:hypothetical protein